MTELTETIDRAVRRIVGTMILLALVLSGAISLYLTRQFQMSQEANRTLTAIRYILCANPRLPPNDSARLRCDGLPGLVPHGRRSPNDSSPRDS